MHIREDMSVLTDQGMKGTHSKFPFGSQALLISHLVQQQSSQNLLVTNKQVIPANPVRSSLPAHSCWESSLQPHSEVVTLRTPSFQLTRYREEPLPDSLKPCPGIQTISGRTLWTAALITAGIILKLSVCPNRTLISLITRPDTQTLLRISVNPPHYRR